jgi:ATP-dependent DNA helicase RecG
MELQSPGLFAGPVTAANIGRVGAYNRNPILVSHLRDFPDPPNLDAGEGVHMMFGTMQQTGLYPPIYLTQPHIERPAVLVQLLNENRPSLWEQVSEYIDRHGSIGNLEVRQLVESADVLAASRQLRKWVERGQLTVLNPSAAKRLRRYTKPDLPPAQTLLAALGNR